jgi:integrase
MRANNGSSTTERLKGIFLRGKIFWYRYSFQRRQYRVSLETTDESEAITKALAIAADPVLSGAEPIREEVKLYLSSKRAEGKYTRNSADSRQAVLNAWIRARKFTDVHEINQDEITLWLTSLRKRKPRLKETSIESYAMIIRGFCVWLVSQRKLRDNPAKFIKASRQTSAKGRPFCRRPQMDTLINDCQDRDLKFILYAGFHAGLRRDEIVQARPEWFDLDLRIIHIVESADWKPKDKDKRTIPLTKEFRNFLRKEMSVKKKLAGPFLIQPAKKQRKARYRYDFRKPFEEYVREKEMSWVKPHVMRHSFASLLAIAGVSIFKIAQWLGDDVKVVERHYAHLLPQDLDIERAFGNSKNSRRRR